MHMGIYIQHTHVKFVLDKKEILKSIASAVSTLKI